MNPTNIDRLIFARLTRAGLRRSPTFRNRIAADLCQRLKIAEALDKLTDDEIFAKTRDTEKVPEAKK